MSAESLPVPPPMLALVSSFCFASASFIYRRYSLKNGALWMNTFKTSMACVFFGISVWIRGTYHHFPSVEALILLVISGFLGLIFADLLLLSSYKKIGSGRTLMLTSFNPLFLGVAGWMLFGEVLTIYHSFAIVFLCACLLMLGLEDFKKNKKLELSGLAFAMGAAALDASGLLITRFVFHLDPQLDFQFANLIRLLGAACGFVAINFFFRKIHLISRFQKLPVRDRMLATFSSFLGTFFALSLWILAIKMGKLGVVSAMGGFGPLYATSVECYRNRQFPSRYLLTAGFCFLIGFGLIIRTL
jgi:drug/metabolite transporter (DMT)-like permease